MCGSGVCSVCKCKYCAGKAALCDCVTVFNGVYFGCETADFALCGVLFMVQVPAASVRRVSVPACTAEHAHAAWLT